MSETVELKASLTSDFKLTPSSVADDSPSRFGTADGHTSPISPSPSSSSAVKADQGDGERMKCPEEIQGHRREQRERGDMEGEVTECMLR